MPEFLRLVPKPPEAATPESQESPALSSADDFDLDDFFGGEDTDGENKPAGTEAKNDLLAELRQESKESVARLSTKVTQDSFQRGTALAGNVVSSLASLVGACGGGLACVFHGHGLASAASSVGNAGGGLGSGLGVPGFGGSKGGGAGYSPDGGLQWLADNSGYSASDIASGKVSPGELASALEYIFGPSLDLIFGGMLLSDLWDGFMPRTNQRAA